MAEKDLGHLGTYDTDSHTVSGPLGRLTVDRDGSVKDLDGNHFGQLNSRGELESDN